MGVFKKTPATPEVTATPEVIDMPEVTDTPEVTATPEVTDTPEVTAAPVIGDSANELTASLREAVKAFPLASQMNTHIDAIEHLMFVK